MNVYVYKIWLNNCPSLWTCWTVRAESVNEAAQWHNWTDAPKHDHARLIKEIKL